jgi:hypothetical protein
LCPLQGTQSFILPLRAPGVPRSADRGWDRRVPCGVPRRHRDRTGGAG